MRTHGLAGSLALLGLLGLLLGCGRVTVVANSGDGYAGDAQPAGDGRSDVALPADTTSATDGGVDDAGALTPTDAGPLDAGQDDAQDAAATQDGAAQDAGQADDTASDAGQDDAGLADAGSEDGGQDTATPDAGQPGCTTDAACQGKVGQLGDCEKALCVAGECKVGLAQDGKFCGLLCEKKDGAPAYRKATCNAGKCEAAGEPVPCVKPFMCMIEGCIEDKGCVYVPQNDACDDGNVCTEDVCVADKGCLLTPKAGPCDDGDDCTANDACQAGQCKGGANKCTCQSDAECKTINPCLPAKCGPDKSCSNQTAPGQTCDDGSKCTQSDTCDEAGGCVGTALVCDDKVACTQDSCDPKLGCVYQPDSSMCDDGNACTTGLCQSTGCKVVTNDKNACDDGDSCTQGDVCVAAKCTGTAAVVCKDGAQCKTGGCDPQTGACLYQPKADGTACDDNNACTKADACLGGKCGGGKIPCDDGEPCTVDSCDPVKGCVHDQSLAGPCDDGDNCTVGDVCVGGKCQPGKTSACTDGNACTLDACDPKGGCTFPPIAGGIPCGKGGSMMCLAGACVAVKPPAGMVWAKAVTFDMGCDAQADTKCMSHELPQVKVKLDSFFVDVLEVTAEDYKLCVMATKCTPAQAGLPFATYNSANTTSPINYVSWDQAQKFCSAKGRRLCTEAEWEYAARGTDGRRFPWGGAAPTCALAVFNGCATTGPQPVGSKDAGKSPLGLQDMAGNVREWTSDWYAADTYAKAGGALQTNPQGPATGKTRVVRGGTYDSSAPALRTTDRAFIGPSVTSPSVGFRCCKSVQ